MTIHNTAAKSLSLVPLFLIALISVAFEVALTRYFAIASWSEYGYWIISIAMVGLCSSGVVLAIWTPWFAANYRKVLAAIVPLMMLSLALGFWWTTTVKFNPLELQNHALMVDQLLRIGEYYLALFPFFFLCGVFIGLYFVAFSDRVAQIYAADLIGAGVGGLLLLGAMNFMHPFYLPALLVPLGLVAAWFFRDQFKGYLAFSFVAAAISAAILLLQITPNYNEYKAISPPLKVEGSKVVSQAYSPRGLFTVLDNFTERLDIDISNNEEILKGAQPTSTFGFYADGNRLTSLPKRKPDDFAYVPAALDGFAYSARPQANTLLIGTRGGYRVDEVRFLGAGNLQALEPDATLFKYLQQYRGDLFAPKAVIQNASPAVLAKQGPAAFDVIDIASDFLGQSDANKYVFTQEGMANLLGMVKPNGIVSVPMSIREFTVYALKTVTTAQAALKSLGKTKPAEHLMVYRSAWNVRVLISPTPFAAADIAALKAFAEKRSFDISYFPGIDITQQKVWNDLPPVSFEQTTTERVEAAQDALAKELQQVLFTDKPVSIAFDLSPASNDRPFFFSIFKLREVPLIFDQIQLVPREELGYLINLAVLVQACILALLVLCLPLFKRSTLGASRQKALGAIAYFSGLGIGFLMLEIYLIEKAIGYLNDRTTGFALVLAVMLIFSGVGSFFTSRFQTRLKQGLRGAWWVIVVWCVLAALGLNSVLAATAGWPLLAKAVLFSALMIPLAIALGFPFSIGLSSLKDTPAFIPWAWSLNGAFSVIATPLASLLAQSIGLMPLALMAALLYTMVLLALPKEKAVA